MSTINVRGSVASLATALGLISLGVGAWSMTRPRPLPFVGALSGQVPGASAALSFAGKGFLRVQGNHVASDDSLLDANDRSRTIEALAPTRAAAPFQIGSAGLISPTSVTLSGAANVPIELEHGTAIYRSAYPDTDVVAVRDPGHIELAYVIRNPEHAPDLRLDVGPPDGEGSVTREPDTGAIIVRGQSGRPALRIEPPIALDHAGTRRLGRYEVQGDSVRIALSFDGLVPPVVIDPVVAIPFWTILSDGRAPGAVVYNPASDSKETRVVFDPQRKSTLLVRPIRSQQFEDSLGWFAELTQPLGLYLSPIASPSKSGGPTAGPAELREWERVFYTESETWEWANNKWSLLDALGLPGRIDPALAFDAQRQTVVLAGGQASTDFDCSSLKQVGFLNAGDFCESHPDTSAYEFSGTDWVKKPITGAPPPRVRNSLTAFNGGTLLFGGRHLGAYKSSYFVQAYGPPFPDNLAEELLRDTWFYNGSTWEPRPSDNAPTARESAQLVFDPNRNRAVLVGGVTAAGVDNFDLWEFDGTDWVQRFATNDPALPLSLRGRTGALVAWNPARGTTLIFGGIAQRLDACTLSDADIGAQSTVPARKQALIELGCFGGYVHDSWEWDGSTLRQLTRVAFGGYVGDLPVFRQIADQATWGGTAQPVIAATEGGKTPLLPWRYDASANHFPLRSALERAHVSAASSPGPISRVGVAQAGPAITGQVSLVSPLFASRTRPQLSFDTVRGVATLFMPEDGRIFETDGKSWSDRTPSTTPFAAGANDFFAATWDATAQRIVLFDPIAGATWLSTDAGGWTKLNPPVAPPAWTVDPTVRRERDLEHERSSTAAIIDKVALVAQQIPHVVFDRARNRSVMLYRGGLWEFDGATWAQKAAPPGWANCTAATVMAYDGARAKTVAVGCKTPGETMEWDGTSWSGPFPGPYDVMFERVGAAPAFHWQGTLQLTWAHPNSLFESALLGGVSMLDPVGVLRTWNGSTWASGAKLSEGPRSDLGESYGDILTAAARDVPGNERDEISTGDLYGVHVDFVPFAFFPPTIEDTAHARILTFRDGPTGMREWRPASGNSTFSNVVLGDNYLVGSGNAYHWETRIHPPPFELLSAEHIYLRTTSDPSSRLLYAATYPYSPLPGVHSGPPYPGEEWRTPESEVNNLFWPFQLFVDPASQRVRVLTNRGAIWELGGELRQGLGDSCSADNDCTVGYCVNSLKKPGTKLCCDYRQCGSGPCQDCEGAKPGVCEQTPIGQPDPYGRCGSGQCGGVCVATGFASSACSWTGGQACGAGSCTSGKLSSSMTCASDSASCAVAQGTTSDCTGGFACADATSCLTHCSSNSDCQDPRDMCAPDGNSCIPNPHFDTTCQNGMLTVRGRSTSSACPGGLGCADDVSCKAACTTRLDCTATGETCARAGAGCVPDGAAVLASARGVTPIAFSTPPVRSTEEVGALLKRLGYPTDEAGLVYAPGAAAGGIQLAFDPSLKNPLMGVRTCMYRIQTCMMANRKVDECVAGTPRCVGGTPWLGDAAGLDCCPEACLEKYFQKRATSNERVALDEFLFSDCYPGLADFIHGETGK